jgi:hypothetical protein
MKKDKKFINLLMNEKNCISIEKALADSKKRWKKKIKSQ